jgi:hypothetical protein
LSSARNYIKNLIELLLPEKTVEQLELCRGWLKEEEALRVDESKRPGKEKCMGKVLDNEDPIKRLDVG